MSTPPPLAEEEHHYEYYDHEPPPPPRGPGGALVAVVALLAIIGAAIVLFVGARWLAGSAAGSPDPTVAPGIEVSFEIPRGASARTIGAILEENGVVASAREFEREIRLRGLADDLRAGEYTVVTGDFEALVEQLTTGPPAAETYRVTIIEGLRIEEILQSLSEQTPYTFNELSGALLDGSVISPYLPDEAPEGAKTDLVRWEGLLFPDTYEFVVDATPVEILTKLADTMTARVESVDWSRLDDLGVSQYEAIVVASLIEKEAKLDEDRALIASVIYNRLELGMPLQVDATIIYALGENPGRVLFEDLEIESPYNTYKFTGLPPTPIGGVRLASLEAAANPADTDFLFYVLIDPSGKHGFSETLEEHNRKKAQAKADGVIP